MKVFGKCFVFSSLETEFYSWKVLYTNGLLQIQELALQSVSLEAHGLVIRYSSVPQPKDSSLFICSIKSLAYTASTGSF